MNSRKQTKVVITSPKGEENRVEADAILILGATQVNDGVVAQVAQVGNFQIGIYEGLFSALLGAIDKLMEDAEGPIMKAIILQAFENAIEAKLSGKVKKVDRSDYACINAKECEEGVNIDELLKQIFGGSN